MEQTTANDSVQKVSLTSKFSYGLSNTGAALVFTVVTTYLMFYYTDVIKLNLAAVGTLFLVVRIIDIFSGPIYGILIDRTTTKWGKVRPWWLWMALPFGLTAVFTFSIGFFPASMHLALAYVSYILFSFCYAGVTAPVGAILPSLSNDVEQRTAANTFQNVGGQIGGLVAGLIFLPLVQMLGKGNSQNGFFITVLILAVLGVVFVLLAFAGVREQVTPESQVKVPVKDALKAMLPNFPWWIIAILNTIIFIGVVSKISTMVYFYKYALNNEALSSIANGVNSAAMVIGMISVAFFAKKFKIKRIVIVGLVIAAVGQLLVLFSASVHSAALSFIGVGIGSAGLGGAQSLVYILLAETVDEGEYISGVRAQGFLTSMGATGANLGAGLAGVLVPAILAQFHFVPNVAQSVSGLMGINVCFIWLPIAIYVVCIILVSMYRTTYDKQVVKGE